MLIILTTGRLALIAVSLYLFATIPFSGEFWLSDLTGNI
jgi:hypothetical protein